MSQKYYKEKHFCFQKGNFLFKLFSRIRVVECSKKSVFVSLNRLAKNIMTFESRVFRRMQSYNLVLVTVTKRLSC